MKICQKNVKSLPVKDQTRVLALLHDLEDINIMSDRELLYIDWQDYHDEYSPERTDPCPDYYGYYRLKTSDGLILGVEMNIDTLDDCLCCLYDYVAL